MKRFLAKIWVPALLVMLAAAQSFGIDASRAVGLRRLTDSLILTIGRAACWERVGLCFVEV